MQLLRAISWFCVVLLLVSVQCRAKCVVIPHETAKHAPECPLHKNQAPETNQCTHAPQWDIDDTKQFVATVDAPMLPVLERLSTVETVLPDRPAAAPSYPPLVLRI